MVVAVVAGVVLRFWTTSPLWLDEALSVNIAGLDPGEIGDALRRDGHPPLYYLTLHAWMDLVGSSDRAVRALSGLWSVALLPLVWVAGRRLAGSVGAHFAVIVAALSPFAVRYATEARMYAMVSVLALAGVLVGESALRRPTPARLAGVAVCTGLLLWTHYWAFWFLAAAGGLLVAVLVRDHRRGSGRPARHAAMVLGAVAVGGLSFLPWLGTLLYQSRHTGTPWARPMRPAEIVSTMVADFGGGITGEATAAGWFLAVLVLVGMLGRTVGPGLVELDLRTRPEARTLTVLVAGTLAIATVAGYASGAAFASRYAAVIHPFVVLLAALGLARLAPRWVGGVAVGVLVVLSGVGLGRNVVTERTDAGRNADAIASLAAPGDLVVYCPDQLGPATSRVLDAPVDQVTFPAFAGPERVDWVDYRARVDATDLEAFGDEVLRRAGDASVFLVYSTGYETHAEVCPELFNALARQRPPEVLTEASEAFEAAGVARFAVPAA